MTVLSLNEIVTQLRVVLPDGGELTDGQLLAQFIGRHDEAAFSALVKRHGPMVLGVCRRLLGNVHDADDAFQATFLILVHKAASVIPRQRVGNWLYGVAYNTALAARAKNNRRRSKEKQVTELPEPAMPPPDDGSDLRPFLDRELSRLADVYREAIVLCDLEGTTRKEAAQKLGIPEGTMSSRLTMARRQLAKRLSRHGLMLSGGAVATLLSQSAASACVPLPLAASTVKAAATVAAGSATAGVVFAGAAALTEGVLRTMFLTKVKKTLTAVILAIFLAAGIVLVGHTLAAAVPVQDNKEPKNEEARKEEPKKENLPIIRKIVISASGGVNLRQTGKESVNGTALKAEDLKAGVLELAGAEEVTVEVKELPELVVEGSGNVTATDIKAKRAAITIRGSGEVLFSGTANEQVVISVGSGGFNGRELKGKQATVIVDGSADVIVNVADLLKASIGGSGSIRYCGSPRVEESVSGSGSVVPCTDKDK